MKAIKLPSGNYRVQVYIGESDGKKKRISITEKTAKEALRVAYNIQKQLPATDSFGECLERYISSKTPVLSPATIVGYKNIQKRLKNDFGAFYGLSVGQIKKSDVQAVINGLVTSGNTPKTVRNFNGLISATLKANNVILGQITMPKKYPSEIHIPTKEHIKEILKQVKGTDLEIPIMLSCFAGVRRGEVSALQWSDFDFEKNTIHVSKDVVKGPDGKWYVKPPKTKSSDRYIQFPEKHMERIKKIGALPGLNPNALSDRFRRLMIKMGYPYHFHTLRHFCASYMHSIGIPDSYIMQRCGWENDTVLKSIYRHTLADQEEAFTKKTNSDFEKFV